MQMYSTPRRVTMVLLLLSSSMLLGACGSQPTKYETITKPVYPQCRIDPKLRERPIVDQINPNPTMQSEVGAACLDTTKAYQISLGLKDTLLKVIDDCNEAWAKLNTEQVSSPPVGKK